MEVISEIGVSPQDHNNTPSLTRWSSAGHSSSHSKLSWAHTVSNGSGTCLKVIVVVTPLVLSLVAVSIFSTYIGYEQISQANVILKDLELEKNIIDVVDSLERERDMTCLLVNSVHDHDIIESQEYLWDFRNDTDALWQRVTTWTADATLPNPEMFQGFLHDFRQMPLTSCQPALKFYKKWIDYFLIKRIKNLPVHGDDHFFVISAYENIVELKNLISLIRTEGVIILANPNLNDAEFEKIIGLLATINFLFESTNSKYQTANSTSIIPYSSYQEFFEYVNAIPLTKLTVMTKLKDEDYHIEHIVHEWFENLTEYLKAYTDVQKQLGNKMESIFLREVAKHMTDFNALLYVMISALVVSPPCIGWYIWSLHKQSFKIIKQTGKIKQQELAVLNEKQKTELLLHQILPKAIVTALLNNRIVEPEFFESITVLFNDIGGFPKFCEKSTPIQIVSFLNTFYTKFDEIIEFYDCYKVDVIGPSYVVASGLPVKNLNHSEEVCSLALDLVRTMSQFKIDDYKVCIKIGCHTGPIVAGVIGHIMPKYCLFGDTINTAARMESTAMYGNIQISGSCMGHMQICAPHKFYIKGRGKINVKGKGLMNTFWVLRKVGFPFEISSSIGIGTDTDFQ